MTDFAPETADAFETPAAPEAPAPRQTLRASVAMLEAADRAASNPDRNFLESIGKPETRDYLQRKGFKSVEALGESFVNLERLLSSDTRRVALPAGEDDAEGYNRVYAALGRPETPADYGLEQFSEADPEFAGAAAEWLWDAGVGGQKAAQLAERWNGFIAQREQAAAETFQAQSRADIAGLKTEWGPDYDANIEHFRRGVARFGLEANEMAAIETTLGTRRAVSLFSRIGQGLGEASFIGGDGGKTGFGLTRDHATARINALKKDEAWQQRWMNGGADERDEWTRLVKAAG